MLNELYTLFTSVSKVNWRVTLNQQQNGTEDMSPVPVFGPPHVKPHTCTGLVPFTNVVLTNTGRI